MFPARLLLISSLLASPVLGQSAAATDCSKSNDVRVYRAIMDPQNVKDVFGTRIAKRYVALQVTISNQCKDHQFLIHDLSLDLTQVIPAETKSKLAALARDEDYGNGAYELSSEELSILRGIAEKGQIEDKRNKIMRLLRAAGAIAGGITGVASFGSSYAPSVAAFNGPFITALAEAFPDFTINQLIRLSDSAYISNTLVPKQQAKVIVVFMPQRIFLNESQRKQFWDDPTSVLPTFDYRLIDVVLDGNYITEVEEPEPMPTGAVIAPAEMASLRDAGATAQGFVVGRNLAGCEIRLINNLDGASAAKRGTPTQSRLDFTLTGGNSPISSGTVLEFEVFNTHATRRVTTVIQYPAAAPAQPPAPPPAAPAPATVTPPPAPPPDAS